MVENTTFKTRPTLTPDIMLRAYATGIFPMSESRDASEIFWVDPTDRGVLPLDRFHISRSLAREIKRERYQIKIDTAFSATVAGCADREDTWINDEIAGLYDGLFQAGHAHSIEVWQGRALVGGAYGVTLGAAFFGESMFSHRPNTSKIALAYLVLRLRVGGFKLFDTQFITPHLASLGGIELPRTRYHTILSAALQREGDFYAQPEPVDPQDVLQVSTQTS
ncbi:MAG: leucyl/phenylalanyl-tRNA--protein transferase [Pseudomonadota bacterium]